MGFGSNPLPGKGASLYPRSQGILTFSSPRVTVENLFGVTVSGTFDATLLCKKVTAWEKRILKKAGSYTRSTMRRSMRDGKYRPDKRKLQKGMTKEQKAEIATVPVRSEPQEPPKAWYGKGGKRPIKDSIYYFVNEYMANVRIGPQRFNKRGNALEVLEFGGSVQMPSGASARVEARPYAAPAQEVGAMFMAKLIREAKPIF